MLRAVIVEDEMLVKLGMKICVENAQQNIVVAAALSSAEEAISFFKDNSADILITDIKLTGLSGLDLIEKIKDKHKNMLIIVLSCYEDFSYARRAYELGADTYILKHELKEDALVDIIIDLYQKKFKKSQSDNNLQKDTQRDIEIDLADKNSVVGLLWLRAKNAQENDYENISFPMLCETVNEVLTLKDLGKAFLYHNQNKVVCIFPFDIAVDAQTQQRLINEAFSIIQGKVDTYFNMDCLLYISQAVKGAAEVEKAYEKLNSTKKYLFYCNNQSAVPCLPIASEFKKCEKLTVSSQNIFSKQWCVENSSYLKLYFSEQIKNLCDSDSLKIEVDRYLHFLRQQLLKGFGITFEEVFKDKKTPNYMDIEHMAHSQALLEWILGITQYICDRINSTKFANPLVGKILTYVQENYTNKITLEDVAEEFHVNTTYLCKIFKKNTGENFVTYLNNLRIEEAISLLNTTDMTIEQIAEAVGIRTPNYFFRLFKKVTGKTVGSYRKR